MTNDEIDRRIDEALRGWPVRERGENAWEALASRIEKRLDEALPVLDATEPPRFLDETDSSGTVPARDLGVAHPASGAPLGAAPASGSGAASATGAAARGGRRARRRASAPLLGGLAVAAAALIGIGVTATLSTRDAESASETVAIAPAADRSTLPRTPMARSAEPGSYGPTGPPQGQVAPSQPATATPEPAAGASVDRRLQLENAEVSRPTAPAEAPAMREESPGTRAGELAGGGAEGGRGSAGAGDERGMTGVAEPPGTGAVLSRITERTRRCGGGEPTAQVRFVVDRETRRPDRMVIAPTLTPAARQCIERAMRATRFPPMATESLGLWHLEVPLTAEAPPARVLNLP